MSLWGVLRVWRQGLFIGACSYVIGGGVYVIGGLFYVFSCHSRVRVGHSGLFVSHRGPQETQERPKGRSACLRFPLGAFCRALLRSARTVGLYVAAWQEECLLR